MKRIFIDLIALFVSLAPARGQGLHGRILVIPSTLGSLLDPIRTIYSGQIDTSDSVPQDLSIYDAIFVTGSANSENRLITYLEQGGKFYIECSELALMEPDTLLRYLGVRGGTAEIHRVHYRAVTGVPNEFTNGIDTDWAIQGVEPFYLDGSLTAVLVAVEDTFGIEDPIAWIPNDSSIHAVIYYAVGPSNYEEFLTRVLCDYFGLCTDAVQARKPTPSTGLRIVSDGNRTWLNVEGGEAGELDIENALGVRVFHCTTTRGGERIPVPNALPSGFYFARLQRNGVSEMQPFAFVQK